jgi:subtilisin family serine protease
MAVGEPMVADSSALVGLTALMGITAGVPDVSVALIDGPIVADHPDLVTENIRRLSPITNEPGGAGGAATAHGTFVAGMLAARRGSGAPAICPGCMLLVRPIFPEIASDNAEMPSATPDEVAEARLVERAFGLGACALAEAMQVVSERLELEAA